MTGGYEDSPDGKYRLWIRTFGAYGHAFSDRTGKTLQLRLVERIGSTNTWHEKLLCEKTYWVKCADFGLDTSWIQKHGVNTVVYSWDTWEYSKSKAPGVASNYIATLTFEFGKSGNFSEKK